MKFPEGGGGSALLRLLFFGPLLYGIVHEAWRALERILP